MADKEFFSFEEALRELRLKEEELKRLVSEGEIRAFRDGETMRLRRSDVENLRNELTGGEVVELGEAGEELVFEDDTDLDAGMATEEISEADTLLEDGVEDVGEVQVGATAGGRRATTTVRRTTTVAEEPGTEGMGVRIALMLTALVLVLGIPVCLSATSGTLTDIAAGIANIFAEVKK